MISFYIQFINFEMKLSQFVDPTRCYQLVTGFLGIYITYLATGVIHESMLKSKYHNSSTGQQDVFTWPSGFLIFPCAITWIIGEIVNSFQIKKQERTNIPAGKAALCAVTVAISTLTYTYAIYLTNFPVVMMFKSCNILSVILVGVLCSRVKDKKLHLGTKKIIVGVLVTAGIIMFKYYDPEAAKKDEKKTEIVGIILLVVSLLADGFLPDFQAEIKSVYKPQPMEMMASINKWVAIIAVMYSCALLEIWDIALFIYEHHFFVVHMLAMGVLSTFGQMFVYRMIKQFKQHFAPFVITTRKIFTVGLSIFYYHHETNGFQLAGLILVFAIVTYEFVSEMMQQKQGSSEVAMPVPSNQAPLPDSTEVDLQIEPVLHEEAIKEQLEPEEIREKQKQIYQKKINQPKEEDKQKIVDLLPTDTLESH